MAAHFPAAHKSKMPQFVIISRQNLTDIWCKLELQIRISLEQQNNKLVRNDSFECPVQPISVLFFYSVLSYLLINEIYKNYFLCTPTRLTLIVPYIQYIRLTPYKSKPAKILSLPYCKL